MGVRLNSFLEKISGVNLTPGIDISGITIEGGYVSDLLSDVMGSAQPHQVWITIMKHLNVIAVASMTGIPCIVFAKDSKPDDAVIKKAIEEGICLVSSEKSVFEISGILYLQLHQI
ncbi:MAG TPA: hypothetical protein PLE74_12125 [Candidatus Cloacimonadota bacterium]|nr:hypothetical protein [Candidatus Cloacimonadota bacterium]HPT73013.1 hypothetical protein [Candidatus Cloacimonadota bacterium]